MALRIAVDVNRYVDFARGVDEAVACLRRAGEILLPFVVLAELRAGFRIGQRAKANEAVLSQFLQSDRVTVLLADEQTTHVYADIFAQLRRAGTPIPTNDLWIAALVIQHDLVLFSRDQHFDALPQIARI
jgi:tRNA(fMet)-specific endonuclease VapC